MRIPDIAKALVEVAQERHCPPDLAERILLLTEEMGRRVGPRRPRQSATMTPQLAHQIRVYYYANRNLTQTAIARHFNVNPGRVSEAIHGKKE